MALILLVRHGQASWGADDYDVLSATGWDQARVLGGSLRDRGINPADVVTGQMRRHAETATGAGYTGVSVDPGWDEFDHVTMLSKVPMPAEASGSREKWQTWFEEATDRWTSGEYDDYDESFADFTGRVDEALRRLSERADDTTVVVSSGGPISWVAASLIGRDLSVADRVRMWRRLNPVCANSGVTRLVTGRRGISLVGFNETAHLDGTDLLTYR